MGKICIEGFFLFSNVMDTYRILVLRFFFSVFGVDLGGFGVSGLFTQMTR